MLLIREPAARAPVRPEQYRSPIGAVSLDDTPGHAGQG